MKSFMKKLEQLLETGGTKKDITFLVLATPTAIMAAIGNATKHGFLIREGDALERLAKVSKITFDKTGTLTYGTPKVIVVKTI